MKKACFEEPKFDMIAFSVVDTNVVCSGIGNQDVNEDDERTNDT